MKRLVNSWAASVLLKLAKLQVAENRGERFLKLAADARSRIVEISPHDTVTAHRRGAVLIDVREKVEFQRGHIPGAINLPRGMVELEIENRAPDVGVEIIVYCGGGNRSALVADNLQRMGYAGVKSIAGGFQSWLDAGYPAWQNSQIIED